MTQTTHIKRSSRKTGFRVWIFSESYWHRTYKGALRQAIEAQDWASDVTIEDVATGKQV